MDLDPILPQTFLKLLLWPLVYGTTCKCSVVAGWVVVVVLLCLIGAVSIVAIGLKHV